MKSIINIYICGLLLIITCSQCRTTGHFTNNPKEKIAFAGSEIILKKDKTFSIKSWTDNYTIQIENGKRIYPDYKSNGEGIYKRFGDSLQLTFQNTDSLTIEIDYRQDSIYHYYYFTMMDLKGDSMTCLMSSFDKDKKVIQTGGALIKILKEDNNQIAFIKPLLIQRYEPEYIPIPRLKVGEKHIVKVKTYWGYYAKGDQITIYLKPVFTGIRTNVFGKNRYIPKKWKWKWLNSLYQDY